MIMIEQYIQLQALGYDIELSSMHGFAELGLSLAASESNSRTGSTATIPTYIEIGAGIRF